MMLSSQNIIFFLDLSVDLSLLLYLQETVNKVFVTIYHGISWMLSDTAASFLQIFRDSNCGREEHVRKLYLERVP